MVESSGSSPIRSVLQTNKPFRVIESAVKIISKYMNIVGITVLLAMTAMTVIDVIGRIFKRPIIGGTEITEFEMVTIVFLCLGWAAINGKMITVDLITTKLSQKIQGVLNCITMFIGLGVIIVITWRSYLATLDVQKDQVSTMILKIPSAPFMWVLSIGFSVLCLVMLVQLVQNLVKAVGK
jgi:TRAP-type transport system small permease protein